jgi:hypothetical protein
MLKFLALLYFLWLVTLYVLQGRLIFPGTHMRTPGDSLARPENAEPLWLDAPRGTRTEAWFIPGVGRSAESPGALVVFAHGNAELIDDLPWSLSHYTQQGISLLLIEYRGYGRSTGSPGQQAIVADYVAMLDRVVARGAVDPARLIFHGRSVGGGVIAQLAAQRRPGVLILESTFTSLSSMATRYLALPFLLRHPFHTDRVIGALGVPILIMHGSRDRTIPVCNGRKLHALAPQSQYVEFEAGHNDFPPDLDVYWETIDGFLGEHLPVKAAP